MQIIPQSAVFARYDALPREFREAMFSLDLDAILEEIAHDHHLAPPRARMFKTLVGDVFYGFLHTSDFERVFLSELHLDARVARETAADATHKVFALYEPLLSKRYRPYVPGEERADTAVKATTLRPQDFEAAGAETVLPISRSRVPSEGGSRPIRSLQAILETREASVPTTRPAFLETRPVRLITPPPKEVPTPLPPEPKPFILFEEQRAAPVSPKSTKTFSMPFGFFGKEAEGAGARTVPVRAEVTASTGSPQTPPSKRVVHYSEARTPITPFKKEEDIFQAAVPVTLTKAPMPAPPSPDTNPFTFPSKPGARAGSASSSQAASLSEVPANGNGARLEGNTIHLK